MINVYIYYIGKKLKLLYVVINKTKNITLQTKNKKGQIELKKINIIIS